MPVDRSRRRVDHDRVSSSRGPGPDRAATGETLRTDRRHLLEEFRYRRPGPQGGRGRQRRHAAHGSCCSSAATTATRWSSRSRRPSHRCWSRSSARASTSNAVERVVAGQRLMQASSDIFLGWHRITRSRRREARLLHPPAAGLEGLVRLEGARPPAQRPTEGVRLDARTRPRPLRRPDRHRQPTSASRTPSTRRSRLSPRRYADQNDRDYEALKNAVESGRLEAERQACYHTGMTDRGDDEQAVQGHDQHRHQGLDPRLGAVRSSRMAPEGAPNVLYVVLDDVGFSAMESFGGLIETPNIKRIADRGLRTRTSTPRRSARRHARVS